MKSLEKLRKEIDGIDEGILKAISERLKAAEEIGELKGKSGKAVFDSKREGEVYAKIERRAAELGIDQDTARKIFFDIMQLSKSRQLESREDPPADSSSIKVAFQGEHGAYSEAAVKKAFPNAEAIPCSTFYAVFEALEKGEADAALLPVENSTEGSVTPVYDLLSDSDVQAFREVFLRIEHCLIAVPGAKLSGIKEVFSHPQALEQCRGKIRGMGAKPVPHYDTAGAVLVVKESGRKDAAAIASELAAKHYGMKVLERNVEDNPNNITRFLALSKKGQAKREDGRKYKTSLVFAIRHEPGALFRILKVIADRKINLTKLESRPTKKTPWEYVFFVDLEGHAEEPDVAEALKEVKKSTLFMKSFGSYARGD